MTHESASLIRLWLTSGHGRPQKRQRRTWHFMPLVARLHGSLGCLLELWLSVATPVRPFLTGQQREESFPAPSTKIWREWSSYEGGVLWASLLCQRCDKNPYKPSSCENRGPVLCLRIFLQVYCEALFCSEIGELDEVTNAWRTHTVVKWFFLL